MKRRRAKASRRPGGARARPSRQAGRDELARGAAAGFVAGLVGSLAMTGFLQLLRLADPTAPRHPQHSLFRGLARSSRGEGGTRRDDATARLADRAARLVLRRRLSRPEKRIAGPAVHYLFGAGAGAVYGGLVERRPEWRGGLRFGGAVWLLSDFVGLPLLRLAPPQWRTPLPVHVRGLASHAPYGVVTELVRARLRRR